MKRKLLKEADAYNVYSKLVYAVKEYIDEDETLNDAIAKAFDNDLIEDDTEKLCDLYNIDYETLSTREIKDKLYDILYPKLKKDTLYYYNRYQKIKADDGLKESKKSKRIKKSLKEGTSNFRSSDLFPLLAFELYDDVIAGAQFDDDYPERSDFETDDEYTDAIFEFEEKAIDNAPAQVLSDEEYANLKQDIEYFNYDTDDIADELYDDDNQDDYWNLRDIKVVIEPGYYEGAQLLVENDDSFKYLSEKVAKEQFKRFNDFFKEMKKKYNLTQLSVSARFSTGETIYNKVNEARKSKKRGALIRESIDLKRSKMRQIEKLKSKKETLLKTPAPKEDTKKTTKEVKQVKKDKKLKEGYVGQTVEDFLDSYNDDFDTIIIDNVNDEDDNYEGFIMDIPTSFSEADFNDFDCTDLTINASSETEGMDSYYESVGDFLDDYNTDDIFKVWSNDESKVIFEGTKDELPEEIERMYFNTFECSNLVINASVETEDYDDDIDWE